MSEEFLELIDLIPWEENDKIEFLKEISSFSPEERLEIINDISPPDSDLNPGKNTFDLGEIFTGYVFLRDPITGIKHRAPDKDETKYPFRIDVQVTEDIVAGADDGMYRSGYTDWYGGGSVCSVSGTYYPGFRFQSVNVPNAATIDSAVLDFYISSAASGRRRIGRRS